MSCQDHKEAAVQKNDPAQTINESRESRADEPGFIAADPAVVGFWKQQQKVFISKTSHRYGQRVNPLTGGCKSCGTNLAEPAMDAPKDKSNRRFVWCDPSITRQR